MNKKFRITQPIIGRVLHGASLDEYTLDEKSYRFLLEIQKELSVFEPIEDDEARKIWIEIPRGTAEEMKTFDALVRGQEDDEDNDDLAEYQETLDQLYPRKTQWLFLVTSTYHENTFLKISDRDHECAIFTNRCFNKECYPHDMAWLLEPLFQLVKERVKEIAHDTEAYNRYVDANVPYRQRSGKIRSKELNRILPQMKMNVENRDYCTGVLKELIRRHKIYDSVENAETTDWASLELPAPFDSMTIRKFCKYYRIADSIFWSDSRVKRKNEEDGVDDVEYYVRYGMNHRVRDYDLDSEEDFERFAKDHYGELGLSRSDVGASKYHVNGKWIITFGVSYSARLEQGLKIALALYNTGAPFIFYNAETLIHVLEETGTVRLSPFTYHDYLQGDGDEGVMSLPFVENCGKDGEITREQYNEIVRLAEWEPDVTIKLDKKISLEDSLYDLIRTEVKEPKTLSEIRQLIEKKYDAYLAVSQRDKIGDYYYLGALRNLKSPQDETPSYYPTFNEALKALILKLNSIHITKSKNNEDTIHE